MDDKFKKAIEKELMRKPSSDFTGKVMDRIFELNGSVETKPLISKWGWIITGIILFILSVYIINTSPVASPKPEITWIQKAETFLSSIHLPKIELPVSLNLYILSGACLAFLLLVLFDHLLTGKTEKRRPQ